MRAIRIILVRKPLIIPDLKTAALITNMQAKVIVAG